MTYTADDIRSLHQPLHECQEPHARMNEVMRNLNTDPRMDQYRRMRYDEKVAAVRDAIADLREFQLALNAELVELEANTIA